MTRLPVSEPEPPACPARSLASSRTPPLLRQRCISARARDEGLPRCPLLERPPDVWLSCVLPTAARAALASRPLAHDTPVSGPEPPGPPPRSLTRSEPIPSSRLPHTPSDTSKHTNHKQHHPPRARAVWPPRADTRALTHLDPISHLRRPRRDPAAISARIPVLPMHASK